MQVNLTIVNNRYIAVNAETNMENADGESAVEAIAKLALLVYCQEIVVNRCELTVSPELELLEDDIADIL